MLEFRQSSSSGRTRKSLSLLPGTTVFRTSLARSKRQANEFAMPAWSEDFAVRYLGGTPTSFQIATTQGRVLRVRRVERSWRSFPSCSGWLKSAGGSAPELARVASRADELRASLAVPRRHAPRLRSQHGRFRLRPMCQRGGNFSYRFYETLSCGRIPVFVDTDCVLPADDLVDWQKICVWVDESELDEISDRVAGFHSALSPSDFTEMQATADARGMTHVRRTRSWPNLGGTSPSRGAALGSNWPRLQGNARRFTKPRGGVRTSCLVPSLVVRKIRYPSDDIRAIASSASDSSLLSKFGLCSN